MENGVGGRDIRNWSMAVEDLVDAGDIDGAIYFLESLVSKVDIPDLAFPHPELTSVLTNLANLYSSKGFSLKANDVRTHASLVGFCSQHCLSFPRIPKTDDQLLPQNNGAASASYAHVGGLDDGETTNVPQCASQEPSNMSSHDDWETIVDRAPEDLVIQCSPLDVSKLSLEESKIQTPKRRGRGAFSSYKKDKLYSDQLLDEPIVAHEDETAHHILQNNTENGHLKYGTRHVLVLTDFEKSTKTIDLEKLYENFAEHQVSIRWIHDTLALAIFPTPSIALEAYNAVRCPFTVRILDMGDPIFTAISATDLRPPRPRPQTSTRTVKRLIGQAIGLNLSSTNFGCEELRKQEDARRNRIIARKTSKDDAWGDDNDSN